MEFPRSLTTPAEQRRQLLPELPYGSVEEAGAIHRRRVAQNVAFYRANPEGLGDRIAELHLEWDAERAAHLALGGLSLAGLWLGLTRSRLWLVLPLGAAVGVLQQAAARRGPAIDLARRLGFRTRDEINAERAALQVLRGDFAASEPLDSGHGT